MGNLNVAVLGKPGFGAGLGKKGTASDITFYNLKRGEDTVTFIEPTKYPERLAPLFYAVSIAKMAILVVEKIDAAFGETALMLDSAGVGKGLIVLAGAPKEKVAQLVKGTLVERYEFFEGDVNGLREKMVSMARRQRAIHRRAMKGDAWRSIMHSTSRVQARWCWGRSCRGRSGGMIRLGPCLAARLRR